jgi:hypothetical protein
MKISREIGNARGRGIWQRTGDRPPPAGSRLLTRRQANGTHLSGLATLAVGCLLLGSLAACGDGAASANDDVKLALTPSSAALAECMPDATLDVTVKPTTETAGFDTFDIRAHNLPPERSFAVFLLEQAGTPFGAAEYIGDFTTNKSGDAHNTFKLIVQEAFASTVVDGRRVRVDLNEVGVWFADPLDDDFCLGDSSPVTPFDGDNEAGVQAFNSANADPLPAP